jgi:DNA-binding Lrp family transcriptional regulator
MIDKVDIKILKALSKDGRMSYACLADHIHLSQTPTIKRVKRIEESGYITGYAAILNENKLGASICVFVWVTLANQRQSTHAAFQKLVNETPQIMDCYLTAGDTDYLLRVAVDSCAEFEKLLTERISSAASIRSTKSSFALRSVKHEMIPPRLSLRGSAICA